MYVFRDEEYQELNPDEQRTPAPAGPSLPQIAGSNPFVDVSVEPSSNNTALWNAANTVESRYLEVDGTIFYKFKLPEVQINLHFW